MIFLYPLPNQNKNTPPTIFHQMKYRLVPKWIGEAYVTAKLNPSRTLLLICITNTVVEFSWMSKLNMTLLKVSNLEIFYENTMFFFGVKLFIIFVEQDFIL